MRQQWTKLLLLLGSNFSIASCFLESSFHRIPAFASSTSHSSPMPSLSLSASFGSVPPVTSSPSLTPSSSLSASFGSVPPATSSPSLIPSSSLSASFGSLPAVASSSFVRPSHLCFVRGCSTVVSSPAPDRSLMCWNQMRRACRNGRIAPLQQVPAVNRNGHSTFSLHFGR